MHRTIGYLSKRFAQIRPGEARKVLLTCALFCLLIAACYVIKPVGRSLVLGGLGARKVPYLDLACAILMGPLVTAFARLAGRQKRRLVDASCWTMVGGLLVFWRLLRRPVPWAAGAFYVWVAVCSVLVVSLFWVVADDLYRPRDAKRLFGLIGAGGILGGLLGSSIAAVGAQVIGTASLLLIAAGLLALCWVLARRLRRFLPAASRGDATPAAAPAGAERRAAFLSDVRGFARLMTHSRYLFLLAAVVALNKLVSTLVSYQLNPFIEQAFPALDARTTALGVFFGGMNIAAFVVQFGVTSWMLRRWGLLPALLILPLGLLAGTAGLLALPIVWLAASTELFDGSMNYSLQQATKEACYLPINHAIRGKVKPFLDTVVFRFGKALAAVIGILLLDAWRLPPASLSAAAIPLVVVWILAAVRLRRDHATTIRTIMQARAASKGGEPTASRKLALLKEIVAVKGSPVSHAQELIEALAASEARHERPEAVSGDAGRLKTVIGDPRVLMAERAQAIRQLARAADQAVIDYLLGMVMAEEEAALREEALRGLVRLRLGRGRLEFPAQPIRRQIEEEVAHYTRILHVAAIYRQHHRGPRPAEDPVVALLRVLLDESVQRVFQFLTLLYPPEEIHLAYEHLREQDAQVRADAIDRLDHLVDPAMRAAILPILDEDRFLSALDEEPASAPDPSAAYRLLQGAIWDRRCWLSVTALCVIGRLRLTTLRQELEEASRHTVPVTASAARVALQLTEVGG